MLDKSKPYGEIYGIGAARYEQNGKCFDAKGNEIKIASNPVVESVQSTTETIDPVIEIVEPERPDEELSGILKRRIEVTDKDDPMYIERQELLKAMKMFKDLYKVDIKYSIKMDRPEMIHTLREAINGLES